MAFPIELITTWRPESHNWKQCWWTEWNGILIKIINFSVFSWLEPNALLLLLFTRGPVVFLMELMTWKFVFWVFVLLDFGLSRLTSLQFIQYHVAGFYKPTIPQSSPFHLQDYSTCNNARFEMTWKLQWNKCCLNNRIKQCLLWSKLMLS